MADERKGAGIHTETDTRGQRAPGGREEVTGCFDSLAVPNGSLSTEFWRGYCDYMSLGGMESEDVCTLVCVRMHANVCVSEYRTSYILPIQPTYHFWRHMLHDQ